MPKNVTRFFPKKQLLGSKDPATAEARRDALQTYLRGVVQSLLQEPFSRLAASPTKANLLTALPFLSPDGVNGPPAQRGHSGTISQ